MESLVVMAATRLKTKSLLSFICLLNLLNLDTCLGQKKRKPIVTSLNAKWSNTPILLEVVSLLFRFFCTDSTLDTFPIMLHFDRQQSSLTQKALTTFGLL